MKVNIEVDANNIIQNVISFPINENLPTLEINSLEDIHVGYDKFVNNSLVKDQEKYEEALEKAHKFERIQELKNYLKETDYKVFKYLDGEIPEEEYHSLQNLRKAAREEINTLESELA